MNTRAKVIVVFFLALGLAFLIAAFVMTRSHDQPEPPQAPAATPQAVAPSAQPPAPRPAPTGDLDMAWPTAGSPEASSAKNIATRAIQAFVRPSNETARRQWWPRLRPLLSAAAQRDYQRTDPTRVLATRITGAPAEILPDVAAEAQAPEQGDDEGEILIGVPTDAGVYGVWVIIEGPEEGKVARISPVEG